MRVVKRQVLVDVEHKMFEPGERVVATSSRSSLELGKVYVVKSCHPPTDRDIYGSSIIFVEGLKQAYDTEYITTTTDEFAMRDLLASLSAKGFPVKVSERGEVSINGEFFNFNGLVELDRLDSYSTYVLHTVGRGR